MKNIDTFKEQIKQMDNLVGIFGNIKNNKRMQLSKYYYEMNILIGSLIVHG